jgi:hypothetical protein
VSFFPYGHPGHIPGIHAPDGTPVGAIYAMQAWRQAYSPPLRPKSAAQLELEAAMKREGAVCQLGDQPCGAAAVGRCYSCSLAFCPSHVSYEYFDTCGVCRDRQVVEAAAQAEREREEAALREQEAVREHAAAVAAHEKAAGWDPRRAIELDQLIASSSHKYQRPDGITLAVVLGFFGFAGFAFIVVAIGPHMQTGDWVEVAACSAPLLAMLVWAISRFAALAEWRRREGWIAERDELRRLRGCGVVGCVRCRGLPF